ncbi:MULTISPECIES: hypothetical protein [Polaromonas]|uniref:Uncharacterized protein n=1 Tax=Polaromonas aquatica TaxID=332657 RepID=A0ABW1U4M9_9BURK
MMKLPAGMITISGQISQLLNTLTVTGVVSAAAGRAADRKTMAKKNSKACLRVMAVGMDSV